MHPRVIVTVAAVTLATASSVWEAVATAKGIPHDNQLAISVITILATAAARMGQKAVAKKKEEDKTSD